MLPFSIPCWLHPPCFQPVWNETFQVEEGAPKPESEITVSAALNKHVGHPICSMLICDGILVNMTDEDDQLWMDWEDGWDWRSIVYGMRTTGMRLYSTALIGKENKNIMKKKRR